MNNLQHVNDVLISSFDQNSLQRLVRYTFDTDLSTITQGKDFSTSVFELTQWAIKTGGIHELLEAAKAELPNNAELQDLTYSGARYKSPRTRSDRILMESQSTIEFAIHLIRQLEKEFKAFKDEDFRTFKNIVVGEDWASGVRSVSHENQRQIKDLIRQFSTHSRMVDDRFAKIESQLSNNHIELRELKVLMSHMESRPSNILSTPQNKFVIGFIVLLLVMSVSMVGAGAMGWI